MFGLFQKKAKEEFRNFGVGKVVSLEKVPDAVFAQKLMGDGYALELTEGKITAPISGEIMLVFPTGHAFGIKTADGLEILIHLGIDTVELNGEGFRSLVKQGDRVKQGDTLTIMDLDFIRNAGKSIISPLIFTSGEKVQIIKEDALVDRETSGIIKIL